MKKSEKFCHAFILGENSIKLTVIRSGIKMQGTFFLYVNKELMKTFSSRSQAMKYAKAEYGVKK